MHAIDGDGTGAPRAAVADNPTRRGLLGLGARLALAGPAMLAGLQLAGATAHADDDNGDGNDDGNGNGNGNGNGRGRRPGPPPNTQPVRRGAPRDSAAPQSAGATMALYSCIGFGGGFLGTVLFGVTLDGFGGPARLGTWVASFGTSAVESVAMGEGFVTHLAILGALALLSLATLPWAIAAALRQAGE